MNHREFIKFLLVNGSAAGINFGSRFYYGTIMAYAPSVMVAYFTGMIFAFIMCRKYVFSSGKNALRHQMMYFFLVNLVGVALAVSVSVIMNDYGLFFLQHGLLREEVAHFIGLCVPAISSYFGHKYLSFR